MVFQEPACHVLKHLGTFIHQIKPHQAQSIIGCGAQHLATWNVFECAGDAANQSHTAGALHGCFKHARFRRTVGAQCKCGLQRIALHLLDGQCSQTRVVQATFRHNATGQQAQLVFNGIQADWCALFAFGGAQCFKGQFCTFNGFCATFNGHITHQNSP
jgi:hypothetical protein